MPIRCPQCGTLYNIEKFSGEGNPKVKCSCGFILELSMMETVDDFLRYFESEDERRKAASIQHGAEAICHMILDENCPEVDIEIAKEKLRERVRQLFPDKMATYEMIYESRFKRLWEQFRQ